MDNQDQNIKIVLKTLNHDMRRNILNFLMDLDRSVSFTDLMKFLNIESKFSSQFSYHLRMLVEANFIIKSDDKYFISSYGKQAVSLLNQSSFTDYRPSLLQKISDSFKRLSTREQLAINFLGIGYALFLYPLAFLIHNSLSFIPLAFTVFGFFIFLILFLFSYQKIKYLPSLILLTSIIWLIFLPNNQIKIGIVYITSVIGVYLVYEPFLTIGLSTFSIFIDFSMAAVLFIIMGLMILQILYEDAHKKVEKVKN